jgi:hypothetical protein
MAELILTKYQAQVFRDVETLLKKRGTPKGVSVNPKAYYLSKRIAVYIINNISKNSTTNEFGNSTDVENVYNWLFGVEPPTSPFIPVSNTGTPAPPTTITTNVMSLSKAYTNIAAAQNDDLSMYMALSGIANGPLVVSYDGTLAFGDVLTKTNTPGPPIVSSNNPISSIGSYISFPDNSKFDVNDLRFDNNFIYYFKVVNSSEPNLIGDVLRVQNNITNFQTFPPNVFIFQPQNRYIGGDSELIVESIIPQV